MKNKTTTRPTTTHSNTTARRRTELASASSPAEAPHRGAKEGLSSVASAKKHRHPLTTPTHTGKIARLPAEIRDQLNTRLHDGEPAPSLLRWLNALPEVSAVLAAQFAGRPVTPQNLSAWRRGGFAGWLRVQEARAWAEHFREQAAALRSPDYYTPVSAYFAAPLAVALGRCLQQMTDSEALLPSQTSSRPLRRTATHAAPKRGTSRAALPGAELPAHYHALLELAREFNRLRRSDLAADHHRIDHERWETEKFKEKCAAEDRLAFVKRMAVRAGLPIDQILAQSAAKKDAPSTTPAPETATSGAPAPVVASSEALAKEDAPTTTSTATTPAPCPSPTQPATEPFHLDRTAAPAPEVASSEALAKEDASSIAFARENPPPSN